MSLRRRLVAQFHRPAGLLGRLAGWIMATRPSNLARNRWSVDLLDVRPGHDVLELGPGPGVTLGLLLERVGDGSVTAVDHSRLMLAQCRRRHARAVADGRLRLIHSQFPGVGAAPRFDRILAVNSLQFDGMTAATFEDLAAALKPGGCIAVTFQPRGANASEATALAFGERVAALLRDAGLVGIRQQTLRLDGACAVCVRAARPAAQEGR